MKTATTILPGLALLLLASVGFAQQPGSVDTRAATGQVPPHETSPARAAPIDEIVVVAHKDGRSIRNIAANVSVVARTDLNVELANTLADVFRYTPGVDYEASSSRFGTESINIRGIGGNRVAMLLDGVPLTDQFDVGSFSNATRDFANAGFVEQVEVLRGPASALYGSSAIGGVVAMTTADPRTLSGRGRQGGRLASRWRDDNRSLHSTAMQAVQLGSAGLLGGISWQDGRQADAAAVDTNLDLRDFEGRSAILKLVADDAAGNAFRAAYYHQDSRVRSSLNSMLGSGRFRSTTALEGDDEYRTDIGSIEYRFGSPQSFVDDAVARVYFQDTDVGQATYDERALARRPVAIDRYFSFEQQALGFETNLQKDIEVGNTVHRLGFGLEYRRRQTEEYRDGLETDLATGAQTRTLLGEQFPLRDFPISTSTDWGAYLEDTISAGRWTVIAALRADAYDLAPDADAMYAEDYPFAEVVAISDSELSPKLGLVYRLAASTDVYLQYSHGFRAPPYEDANIGLELPVFNIRAVPNPDLRSERSDGIDAGLRWRGSAGSAHLSLFRTDYEDFIESRVRIGADPVSGRVLFQSQNVARAVIEGIEAGASLPLPAIHDGLSVTASFYLARGENRDNGQSLNSVGPPQAVAGVNWTTADRRWQARLRGTFTDSWKHRDETGGELFKPPGYAVFDAFVTRRFADRAALRAGITNLTDRSYWAWSDIGGLSPGDPVIPYLSRPGRSFTLGLDINW